MKPVVVIPARKGSKGLPGKNMMLLNGKPLIQHSIDLARSLFDDTSIIVSTNDESVIDLATSLGLKVPFIRPESLCSDSASMGDVLIHAFKHTNSVLCNYDCILLLQPTSPFRLERHISEILDLYTSDIDAVMSVRVAKDNPYFNLFEESENGLLVKSKEGSFLSRQSAPKTYALNGSLYVINPASLMNMKIAEFRRIRKYMMPDTYSIDIDSEIDFAIAEYLIMRNEVM